MTNQPRIKKLLIANRGEIAVRVARTAKRMGIKTVAVYSDADIAAPHRLVCDQSVHIGPAAASESYIKIENILMAVRESGADAVHPGYGFLSENAEFAEALEREGVIFVGPSPQTIRAMGSKSAAKDLMEAAQVPVTPGYQGEDQALDVFLHEAEAIGYPVLLKATAGGGGKGMRLVERAEDLEQALLSAQREAKSAFGDDRFLLEKYIPRARHVEVQVFGDGKGNVVHMFERDCSIQRRHQKVIEEAPAPDLPPSVRARLLEAGVNAGRAVNYRGAGTVEFLYDGKDGVYFMEMNTRLQVEHPVSEAITGLDFVEWQLRIAAEGVLPLDQSQIKETGHAFEARLYAEDPQRDFAPSVGTVTTLNLPSDIARIDSGITQGQTITPYYDPMIAKIITSGPTRSDGLAKMAQALRATYVAGVETNAEFVRALAEHPAFVVGDVSTRFIDDHSEALFGVSELAPSAWAVAAIWQRQTQATSQSDPWDAVRGFRLNLPPQESYWLEHDGTVALMHLGGGPEKFEARLEFETMAATRREGQAATRHEGFEFSLHSISESEIRLVVEGEEVRAFVAPHNEALRIWMDGRHIDIGFPEVLYGAAGQQAGGGSLTAPMPGMITGLSVEPGTAVKGGAPIIVMEAMKMEHVVKAPADGIVKKYFFQPGDQVADGDLLVDFEEAST